MSDSQRVSEPSASLKWQEGGPVRFGEDPRLEGVLEWPETELVRGGVVVAHPHPLHGGTMAQPVVYRSAQASREAGFASLRFNFRGVGKSEGTYSGRDEYRDVMAACAFLRDCLDGLAAAGARQRLPLALAGYSFGSVMAAVSASTIVPDVLVLIGFAVESDLFPKAALDRLRMFPNPIFAVCGESDDLAPPDVVRAALEELDVNFELKVIRDTGHFFEGKQREVGEAVASFIAKSLE